MKLSRRARRMKQHHARAKNYTATLNMVSLMDIFTILVFFLLVNATSAEVLPSPQNITLPNSVSEILPLRNLVIAVNEEDIRIQGRFVISFKEAMSSSKTTIKPLYDALRIEATSTRGVTDKQGVKIMGDKKIPFKLLKKIMLTCAGAEYTKISFAVNQKLEVAGN